jgi:hypothetical protein
VATQVSESPSSVIYVCLSAESLLSVNIFLIPHPVTCFLPYTLHPLYPCVCMCMYVCVCVCIYIYLLRIWRAPGPIFGSETRYPDRIFVALWSSASTIWDKILKHDTDASFHIPSKSSIRITLPCLSQYYRYTRKASIHLLTNPCRMASVAATATRLPIYLPYQSPYSSFSLSTYRPTSLQIYLPYPVAYLILPSVYLPTKYTPARIFQIPSYRT